MSHIIGIDLGTTNSLVSIWRDGKAELIPNAFGEYLTPSVVSFDEDGTVYVGSTAKERLVSYPDSTFAAFKRFMGRETALLKGYKPEELSALVLKKLKADAEYYLGETVSEAVISVPAYFDDKARNATKVAGALAGLEVNRIINEPSAAALSYLRCIKDESLADSDDGFREHSILIFDFGGGTLDVSLVDTFENVVEIVAVSGNNALGGIDFDKAIALYFLQEQGLKVTDVEKSVYNVILRAAEQVKRDLTENNTAVMKVSAPNINAQLQISNKEFIHISEDVLKKVYKPVQDVIRDSGRSVDEITDIVLVGGSSRMPIVQRYLSHVLERNDIIVADPDNMIALGMGVYAGIKERDADVKDMILTDVCPFSLGTDIHNEFNPNKPLASFIISRNTALPVSRTEHYHTVFDNQTGVRVSVYQGEELYAEKNKKIGEVHVPLPKGTRAGTTVSITFSYDLNGILVVDVWIPDFDIRKNSVIVDSNSLLSQEVIDATVEKLNNIKFMAQDSEEDNQILEWGERLFAQSVGEAKNILARKLLFYSEQIKNTRDIYRLNGIRKYMKMFLLYYEASLFKLNEGAEVNYDELLGEEEQAIEDIFNEWDDKEK